MNNTFGFVSPVKHRLTCARAADITNYHDAKTNATKLGNVELVLHSFGYYAKHHLIKLYSNRSIMLDSPVGGSFVTTALLNRQFIARSSYSRCQYHAKPFFKTPKIAFVKGPFHYNPFSKRASADFSSLPISTLVSSVGSSTSFSVSSDTCIPPSMRSTPH